MSCALPVFDIEAEDWTNAIAVGFYNGQYHEFIREHGSDDVVWRFLSFLRQAGIPIVYAHCAADYDNKLVLDCLSRHNQTPRFESGFAKLHWVEAGISFLDSYQVCPISLSGLCDAFGVERKLEWDHNNTHEIWSDPDKMVRFRAYMKRDCISLSKALGKFHEQVRKHFGIEPASTLSLTAVKAFNKSFYPLKDIHANEEYEEFLRAATYGGRNEVYSRCGINVYLYDIKSMYPSCYDVPMPVGELDWVSPDLDLGGLAEAKVTVPDNWWIGPLPVRWRDNELVFPIGKFQGWWDTRELRFAAEKGCDVKVIRQLSGREEPVLKGFGEYVCGLRDHGNEDWSKIWKIMALRLAGKLGQHRWMSEVQHVDQIDDLEGWAPMDRLETYNERRIYMQGSRAPFIRPALNMRVRAEARIRHLSLLLGVGHDDAFYCDTDSIYTSKRMPVGTEAGDLQLVDFAKEAFFVRPKFYGYINTHGRLVQKSAGFRDIRLTRKEFCRLTKGNNMSCTYRSMPTQRELLRTSGLNMVDRHRTIKGGNMENRILKGLKTYPVVLGR